MKNSCVTKQEIEKLKELLKKECLNKEIKENIKIKINVFENKKISK